MKKITQCPVHPTHIQTPPTSPGSPPGLSLVPVGRRLHQLDAQAEQEAFAKRLRFPSMRMNKMWAMSTARLLRAADSRQHSVEQAEAGGACCSKHHSCSNHALLAAIMKRTCVHPSPGHAGGACSAAAAHQRRGPMSRAAAWDQWLTWATCRGHRCAANRSARHRTVCDLNHFTELPP